MLASAVAACRRRRLHSRASDAAAERPTRFSAEAGRRQCRFAVIYRSPYILSNSIHLFTS